MSAIEVQGSALSGRVRVVRGSFALDAEVSVEPGDVLGVIGANGSGKSTLLGALAGTLEIVEGEVRLGERALCRGENGRTIRSVPRAARRVGLLDQRARLFPHLSARENIAFGPRAQGVPRARALALAEEWLTRIDLPGRGDFRESQLSGGQQQRVAIARTLAADPELLLLDEPFAALDVTSSAELRALLAAEVRRLGIPAILVTHDPVDLIALADRATVFEQGRIGQHGTVAEVLGAPATPFAAQFAGRALLRGVVSGRGTLLVEGAPVPELRGTGPMPEAGREAVASYDPAQARIERIEVGGSADRRPRDVAADDEVRWVGTVAEVTASPTGVRVVCAEWPQFFADISVAHAIELAPAIGDRLELRLPHSALRFATPLEAQARVLP